MSAIQFVDPSSGSGNARNELQIEVRRMIQLVTRCNPDVASKLRTLDRYLGDILVALPIGLLRQWRYNNGSMPSVHIVVEPFHIADVLGPIDPNKEWLFGVRAVREAYEAVLLSTSERNMRTDTAKQWDVLCDAYGRWSSVVEYLQGHLRRKIGELRYKQMMEEFQDENARLAILRGAYYCHREDLQSFQRHPRRPISSRSASTSLASNSMSTSTGRTSSGPSCRSSPGTGAASGGQSSEN